MNGPNICKCYKIKLQTNVISESIFPLLHMVSGLPIHLRRDSHYFSNFCTAKGRNMELGLKKKVGVCLTDNKKEIGVWHANNVIWMPCFTQEHLSCYMEYKSLR